MIRMSDKQADTLTKVADVLEKAELMDSEVMEIMVAILDGIREKHREEFHHYYVQVIAIAAEMNGMTVIQENQLQPQSETKQ